MIDLLLNAWVRRAIVRLFERHEARVMRWLDAIERRGRKKVLVVFAGTIEMSRWYLFRVEDDEDASAFARLPNAYVHKELSVETAGTSHRHPWDTRSLVLRGGYRALVDGVVREYKAGDLAVLRQEQFHAVVASEPGTMTLFIHGFRKGEWEFRMDPCATVCEHCAAKYGVCGSSVRTIPHEAAVAEDEGRWHKPTWVSTLTPGLGRRLRVRRAALARRSGRVFSREEFVKRVAAEHDL